MDRAVSATEARVHFGEMLDEVERSDGPIVISRAGRPVAVVLSFDSYQWLAERQRSATMTRALEEAVAVRELTATEYGATSGLSIDEALAAERRERDDSTSGLR
ncbi:MAG: type II toxin-antitoxin system Phd/YefM family antitoxin [Acidobacteriota bacterium]